MSLFGKYWVHCSICAKGVQVEAGGKPMWRREPGLACSLECAHELERRESRAVMGEDTPSYGTDSWRAWRARGQD
jgi:hypothetical protein